MTTLEREITFGQMRQWIEEEGRRGHIIITHSGDVYHTTMKNAPHHIADILGAYSMQKLNMYDTNDSTVAYRVYSDDNGTWAE